MSTSFNLTSASDAFKIKYAKISDDTYANTTEVMSLIRHTHDFVGKRMEQHVPLGYGGGRGFSSLPTHEMWAHDTAYFTAKKAYARAYIDREAIYASKGNEGAWVDGQKEVVAKAVEGFANMVEQAIVGGSGDGKLGAIAASSGVSGSNPYTLTMDSTFNVNNFEVGDIVNIETGNTDPFLITAVSASAGTITVSRQSGSQTPANSDEVFMQNSEDAAIQGLPGILDATSGSLYNLPVGYRWQAPHQKAAGGASISTDLINEGVLTIKERCGRNITHVVTSFTQYRKLLDLLEDNKRYTMVPARRAPDIGFQGVQIMTDGGPVPVLPSRYCAKDRVMFLNTNYITLCHRKGFGWFDEDNSVFMRLADEDAYEARYGGYLELYAPPGFHGTITGLAT